MPITTSQDLIELCQDYFKQLPINNHFNFSSEFSAARVTHRKNLDFRFIVSLEGSQIKLLLLTKTNKHKLVKDFLYFDPKSLQSLDGCQKILFDAFKDAMASLHKDYLTSTKPHIFKRQKA